MTPYEIEKCKKDILVFDGNNCVSNALDFLMKLNGQPLKNINKKIIEYKLQLHAYDGSGLDTWIILNNNPCDKHIDAYIKNGRGIFFSESVYWL